MTTATAFTISHIIEQEILADLEVDFDSFRSRIARLSVQTCGTVTDMYTPLGPCDREIVDIDLTSDELIDIEVFEWQQRLELEHGAAPQSAAAQDFIAV